MARQKNWRRITKPPIRATWPSPAPSGIGRNIILFRNDSFWCRHCALGNLGPVLVTGGGVVEPCALQRRENRTTTLPPDYHRGFRPPFRSKSRTRVRPFLFFASVDRLDHDCPHCCRICVCLVGSTPSRETLVRLCHAQRRTPDHRYGAVPDRPPSYLPRPHSRRRGRRRFERQPLRIYRRVSHSCGLLDESASRRTFSQ